jgi:hypothetical protein
LDSTSSDWERATGTPSRWFRSDFDTVRLYPITITANPSTTLAAGYGPSDTSFTVADASDFPSLAANQFFLARITNGAGDMETVKVTASASSVLTLSRAQEGTTALTFLTGDAIELLTLKAKIAVRPTLTATTIDPLFFAEYRMPVAAGAKAALMLMPSKPWSNPALGAFYRQEFERAIDRARIQAFKSRGNLSTQVKPRAFGS